MMRLTMQERKDKRELLLRKEKVTMNNQDFSENVSFLNTDPNMDINDYTKDISSKNKRGKCKSTENSSKKETNDPNTVGMIDSNEYVTNEKNRVKKRKMETSSEREEYLHSFDEIKKSKKKQRVPQKKKCNKKRIENTVVCEEIVLADNVINLPFSENSYADEITMEHSQYNNGQEIYDIT